MTEMNTAPQLAPRERCTGCAACCNGCPKGAIRMVPDREGFLYPQVTDGCVQCGHCTHICPVLKQREPRTEPAAFIVWNGDEAVRRNSTAGGAFSALAEYVLEGGGVVFGAALDSGLRVSHIAVKNRHDLPRLRGSKPVQSDVGESYQQVRLDLDQYCFPARPVRWTACTAIWASTRNGSSPVTWPAAAWAVPACGKNSCAPWRTSSSRSPCPWTFAAS